jgi:hypothetical protein
VVPKSPEAATKKAGFHASKRLKKASAASTSLPVIPTDDVSAIYFCCLLALNFSSHALPWTDFDEKVHLLGY